MSHSKRQVLCDHSNGIVLVLCSEMNGIKGTHKNATARAVQIARIVRRSRWSSGPAREQLRTAMKEMLERLGGAKSARFTNQDRAEFKGALKDSVRPLPSESNVTTLRTGTNG